MQQRELKKSLKIGWTRFIEMMEIMMERRPEDFVKGLVSVITPVFNAEKYLDRTLASVFAQTYKYIEIVLVDDQSRDGSAKIIKEYQKKHPEIVYYLQPENKGAGYARNKALELAKGEVIYKGDKVAIVGVGGMMKEANEAYNKLKTKGYNVTLVNPVFEKDAPDISTICTTESVS